MGGGDRMSLDGQSGTLAIAELDGGGRTNFLTDGLQWQLLRAGTLLPLTVPTATGIVQGSGGNNDKYTLTFTRPSPGGQYVLRWLVPNIGNLDADFATTDAIPGAASFIPTVDDVGARLRARTKDNMGNELGTFTSDTRPTDQEVLVLIGQAYDDVVAEVDDDIPESSWRQARTTIALRAAILVELSYWPDQVPSGQSPYAQLLELYEGPRGDGGSLASLKRSIAREAEEEIDGEQTETPGQAWYGFGDTDGRASLGMRTIW